jgi:multidrug efflux pump subunit AcrA (membrane-fusion protein)
MNDERPVFRKDLDVIPRISGGRPNYLVRDPRTQSVFELGEEELFLCQSLDGAAAYDEIAAGFQARFGGALTEERLTTFVRQLRMQGLLEAGEAAGASDAQAAGGAAAAAPGAAPEPARTTPPAAALPGPTLPELLAPEHFVVEATYPLPGGASVFGWLARHSGWLFGKPAQWIGAAVILAGLWTLFAEWDRLTRTATAEWGPRFFLLFVLPAALLIRSLRSVAQGIHHTRMGGQVREVGVALLYYVLPSLYCDWWTDALFIRKKSERFWRVASGLYLQALLWAIATLGWRFTLPGGTPNTLCLAVSAAAALSFLLANANPLVQMEGYLILINQLEIPRLRERALRVFGERLYSRPSSEPLTRRERRWFTLYGGLAFLYVVFMIGLHLFFTWFWLTDALEGPGALLTLAVAAFAFQKPLLSWLRGLRPVRWLLDPEAPGRRRAALAAGGVALLVILSLPYPYSTGGPLHLLPSQRVAVRSEIEGLVEEVLVREGEWVDAGQPVARLSPRVHQRNLDAAEAQLAAARADLELARAGARKEMIERAQTAVASVESRLAWSRPHAERAARLYRDRMISEEDYETAYQARDMDSRALDEARAELKSVRSGARRQEIDALASEVRRLEILATNYRENLGRTTLTSPIAGRVVTPRPEEARGLYLTPGQRDLLLMVENPRIIRAIVEVPEDEAAALQTGAPVRAIAWALHDRTFEGTIVAIAPVVTDRAAAEETSLESDGLIFAGGPSAPARAAKASPGRAVRVTAELPNPDGLLRSEMTGYAKIAAGSRPLWDVLLRPLVRWVQVEVWSWIP